MNIPFLLYTPYLQHCYILVEIENKNTPKRKKKPTEQYIFWRDKNQYKPRRNVIKLYETGQINLKIELQIEDGTHTHTHTQIMLRANIYVNGT